jgi:hypothetical protein
MLTYDGREENCYAYLEFELGVPTTLGECPQCQSNRQILYLYDLGADQPSSESSLACRKCIEKDVLEVLRACFE